MINLVKNELIKIFHKKGIYVIAIITALFVGLTTFVTKLADSIGDYVLDDSYYSMLEENLKNYDLNNAEELNWYVSEKDQIDLYKVTKDYDSLSWQYYLIETNGYDYIDKMNRAQYILKDDTAYEEAKKELDIYLQSIKEHDWQYFVQKDKEESENKIKEYKSLLEDETIDDSERQGIEKQIEVEQITLDGYNYRLDKNIPYGYDTASSLISEYVSAGTNYISLNKDEKTYISRGDLLDKREVEKTFYVAKYKLDNDLYNAPYFNASDVLYQNAATPILFIVVAIVMIAGTIVSEEFNKGTIKQLLLRPYTRVKVLLSKYIATLIVFGLFILFYEVISFLFYGLTMNFQSYTMPIVEYSFVTHEVIEINLFGGVLLNLLSVLPVYILILTLAFFLGTIFSSGGVAITISFLVYLFGDLINGLISLTDYKVLRLFPTMCWNFNHFLYGNLPIDEYVTFYPSLIVVIVTFVILFGGAFIIFTHKDIKNQ